MARMSIDDSVLRDPRVLVLAKLCGWSRRETLGALLDVWAICYDHVTDVLPAEYIDVAAALPDFAKHLISCGLATECARGVTLKGVKQRIEYLEAKASAGRAGGRKSGESRRRKSSDSQLENGEANAKQDSKQTPSTTRSKPQAPRNPIPIVPDLPSASVPDPVPVPDQEREKSAPAALALSPVSPIPRRERKARTSAFACSPDERASAMVVLAKLGERNGTAYEGCDEHLRLIVSRLREGKTESDLRKVVAYCAEVKKWESDPEWTHCLNPSTLFGPKNITRYLDEARAWAAREYPNAKLEVVR